MSYPNPPTPPRRGVSSLIHRDDTHATAHTDPRPDLSALVAIPREEKTAADLRATLDQLGRHPHPDNPYINGHRHQPPTDHHRPARPSTTPVTTAPSLDADEVARARWQLDRALVRELAGEAANLLVERRRQRDAAVADSKITEVTLSYTSEEIREQGAQIIQELVRKHIQDTIDRGGEYLGVHEEAALNQAVYDQVFNLGVIQPLVDRPDVENITVTGGEVTIMFPDGSKQQVEGVFESAEEAISWVRNLADRAPGGGRPFSPAHPALRLDLGGTIRLSAMGWTIDGPSGEGPGISIAIRKHLHKNITLDRLVEMDVMPPQVAELLRAAVESACSVIISGPMGVGKTTMIRALCETLPIETRIGTAELVRELYLHQLPGRRPYVVSAEVITGGGERNEFTDQLKGQFNLHQILQEFVSQQLDRVIVGEVAGREILAMFKAMQMAHGSMTTVHATSARGAIDRLVTLALEEPGVDEIYAIRQVAAHVQLIVQMRTTWWTDSDGTQRSHRHISELAWVEPGENARPALSILYRRRSPNAEPEYFSLPEPLRERITPFGFELSNWPLRVGVR